MADRNRTAVHIDLRRIPAHLFVHADRLRSKCFIDFHQIHFFVRPAGFLQAAFDCRNRTHTHDSRIDTGGCISLNTCQYRQAEFLCLLCRHHHHSCSTIVDTRSIAGSNCTSLIKCRTQCVQCIDRDTRLNELVGIKYDSTFFAGDFYRNNFIFKLTGSLCSFCFILRSDRKYILFFAGDTVFFRHVFSGDTHVVLVVHIPQTVDDHGIDQFCIAHAETVTRTLQHVRRRTHVFLTTGNDDVCIAGFDGLRCQMRCFQTAATDFINRHSRNDVRQTGLDNRLTCRILTNACRQYLTQQYFTDLLTLQAGFGQQCFDDGCSQLCCRHFCQRSTEFTYCGTSCCHNHHVLHLHSPVKTSWPKISI